MRSVIIKPASRYKYIIMTGLHQCIQEFGCTYQMYGPWTISIPDHVLGIQYNAALKILDFCISNINKHADFFEYCCLVRIRTMSDYMQYFGSS